MRMKVLLPLVGALAVLIAAACMGGIFFNAYGREAGVYAAQGVGQDIVDLFILVPVLLGSLFLMKAGVGAAFYVLAGSLLYTVYSYVIYCFGLHFNRLFLVYCAILGIALYTLIYVLVSMSPEDLSRKFDPGKAVWKIRLVSALLFVTAAVFCLVWLKEEIPALISGTAPLSVSGIGLPTNPVHVLDLAVFLPGMVISGVLLLRKHPLGFVFAPSLLVFGMLMTLAVAGMAASMSGRGYAADAGLMAVFFVFSLLSLAVFWIFTGPARKDPAR